MMNRWISTLFLFVGLNALLCLSGCQLVNSHSRGEKYGGTLRINASDVPDVVFPGQVLKSSEHLIVSQIYCGLVKYNVRTFDIEPSIAQRWKILDNGLTYQFTLRPNAFFQDDPCFEKGKGRKIVASDIKYSIEKICQLHLLRQHELSSQIKNIVGTDALSNSLVFDKIVPFSGIRAINDSILEFKLTVPDELFLHFLAGTNSLVFAKEAFDAYGYKSLVGSGPYSFKYSEIKGHSVALVANPTYFGTNQQKEKLPFIDTIVVSFITSPPKELQLFETGLLDLVLNVKEEYVNSFLDKHINQFQSDPPYYLMKQTTGANNKINISFVRSNVQGFYLNPQGYFNFSEMYFKEPNSQHIKMGI
jgi:oligopeptide transport system substrate-binding protein